MATKSETTKQKSKREEPVQQEGERVQLEHLAVETEKAAEVIDLLPSSGLLSFYDRLRERVMERVEDRGRLSQTVVETLLLVPDVFMLLLRLALDRDVPKEKRALVASALAYFVLPTDFLPEIVFGATGYLDDVVLAMMVLSQAFTGDLAPYAEKHWSGSKKLERVIRDTIETANTLIGGKVYNRVTRLLKSKGVTLKDA